MPPGPVYNWLCVASSACDILVHVARLRASQIASQKTAVNGIKYAAVKTQDTSSSRFPEPATGSDTSGSALGNTRYSAKSVQASSLRVPAVEERDSAKNGSIGNTTRDKSFIAPISLPQTSRVQAREHFLADTGKVDVTRERLMDTQASALSAASDVPQIPVSDASHEPDSPTLDAPLQMAGEIEKGPSETDIELERRNDDTPTATRQLQSSKVPSSRIGRLFHYGGLAASLGYGAASEIIRRSSQSASNDAQQSVMMTEANVTRLVSKLSQMRGAALKLGQFLSIQDTHVLPAEIDKIFRRVQDSAHYMPDWQLEQVLQNSLGAEWARSFTSFDRVPFAAASIGQVHTAVLAPDASPTGAPARVAVKVQFPNIANSIASDLGYINLLLTAGRLLPRGLFLDRTMQVMKQELADECDYAREARFLRAFGAPEHLGKDERFKVPWVWDGSTDRVLVMELVEGKSVGEFNVSQLDKRDRDDIAARIIELCLKELFEFRFMQTDPNWSNFLWNAQTRRVELVDFGATREYDKAFMDSWLRLLQAAASGDREACIQWSLKLGYLTGEENELMLDAHINSMVLLATPFKVGTPQPFAFGVGTQWAEITAKIREQIPVMLQHRLTPPPRETYSLNRKLSGAFLLASRLGATVETRAIWDKVVSKYEFTT
ncbi:atypical kinase COQ8, mitochondrial [Favolaschia claudopus]|uniref:Atypical kinase COQ8, mitochondrial n=1 Tax=Favolaschia claudopus TaxID=2862362 RepID=A0AAW0BX99_9AGAR